MMRDSYAACQPGEMSLKKNNCAITSSIARKMRHRRVIALLGCIAVSTAQAAETLRYVAQVADGTVSGHQVVTRGDDGVTKVDFVFKTNGRGPEIKEVYRLAPDGTYAEYKAAGKTTFGAKVDETFVRKGDEARWHTTSDKGSVRVEGTALYSSLGGTPDGASVALGALAKRADGKLPLIPSGTLTIRRLGETQLKRGSETRQVQLVMLTGVGFTPQFLWATTGTNPRLFAFIAPGFLRLVEEGWEDNGAALEAEQVKAEAAALVDLEKRVGHPLPGLTVIRNARVFDSEHATLGEPSDVYVYRGRISEVLPAGSQAEGAGQVLDAGGRVLLPGLFDMHTHLQRWDGGLHIATGVTSARDMANDNANLQQMISEERAGTLMMPRIVPAGFIEGESQYAARGGFVIKDLQGAKDAVDWYAQRGYPQIKVYNSFPRDILGDTIAYAHERGLRVSGHVPAFLRAQDVVDLGYDEIQHINQLLLNFFVKPTTDTRTLERFYLVAEQAAGLDLDSAPVQAFLKSLLAKPVVVDPTLTAFDFIRQRPGQLSPAFAAVADHMPPDVRRSFSVAEMNIPDDATAARYEKSYQKCIEFVGMMYRAGVPLVAGTDGLAGFTLQREFELYVQAGLTPAQTLQVATWNAAKYARVLGDRGSVTPGKAADLVLVDGDPTRDIGTIRRIAMVMKGDRVYYPSEVFTELGVKPFAEPLRFTEVAASAK